MLKKILIANRGEIACRIIRTARDLGYPTVAVYSQADAHAPHVGLADEAVCIGASAAAQSYLRAEALLEAARRTQANAIHPGYGFLSENAGFAQACADAGLIFIGPPPKAIEVMGDKAGAKRVMLQAGVPCAPGYLGDNQDDAHLVAQAKSLGYPLLVKAVSGGGGRGMRLVHQESELAQALISARREALSAFGDGTLMLERLILNGRHIEIQVFADQHGGVVHLGERDCTAQRRRQKVIEEAPSPVVSAALREAMGRDAVLAAKAIGYVGAGTIEYIVDQDMRHYFLEMNTRLQVEHPVTECVWGQDLVAWQLRVADGQRLPLSQAELSPKGHAIEVRLYAEDPYAGFAPQTGTVRWWRPQGNLRNGVRIDDGIAEGGQVSPHYDPMVAKLIAWGEDRPQAIRRLMATLADTPLLGLRHNARFLHQLLDHPRFRQAELTTTLLDEWQAQQHELFTRPTPSTELWAIAAALYASHSAHAQGAVQAASVRHWGLELQLELQADSRQRIDVELQGAGQVLLRVGGQGVQVQVQVLKHDLDSGHCQVMVDGVQRKVHAVWLDQALHLSAHAATWVFEEPSAWPDPGQDLDPSRALAAVAGTVTQILVKPGDAVLAGQPLLSIEAMKMEMWLHAQAPGQVKAVHTQVGQQVQAKALLLEIDSSKE